MLEWIISSAVLLAAVIAVRYALRGRLRPGVQYAMWAIVLVRLLVPVSFGSGAYSAGTAAAALEQTPAVQAVLTPSMDYDAAYSQVAREYAGRGLDVSELAPRQQQAMGREIRAAVVNGLGNADKLIKRIRSGEVEYDFVEVMALTGTNLRLYIRLRRSRRELTREGRMPVYVTEAVDTPCLFGLVRPAVYLTPEAAGDDVTRQHSVAHELTHLRHGDHVWSLLRCVCLAVHWYDPLVWWAAVLSLRRAHHPPPGRGAAGRIWPDPGADDLPQAWKSAGNGYHHDRWGRGDPGAHPLHCEAPTHHRVHCCGTGAGGGGSGRVRLYRFRPEGRAQNADAGHQSAG